MKIKTVILVSCAVIVAVEARSAVVNGVGWMNFGTAVLYAWIGGMESMKPSQAWTWPNRLIACCAGLSVAELILRGVLR